MITAKDDQIWEVDAILGGNTGEKWTIWVDIFTFTLQAAEKLIEQQND